MTKTHPRAAAALALLATVLLSCTLLTGCSSSNESNSSTGSSASNGKQEPQKGIKIEQIDWSAKAGVVDGDRRYLFSCTNNSDYRIAHVEMTWSIKSDVTAEQFKETFSRIMDHASDEEKDEFTDSKIKGFSLSAETPYLLEPGATSKSDPITVGYLYLENEEEYNLFEPDIMTIEYVDGDELTTQYYDFKSNRYSTESESEELYGWPSNDWTKLVPEPKGLLITEVDEDEAEFEVRAIGVTPEQVQSYVKECKAMGFNIVDIDSDSRLLATNADATYKIDVYYYGGLDNDLTITVTKL